ncbi:MAG: DUF924 family protein [Moraxellaceae bacterium]|nr:DUF924 family protein [Moraxellaceae bacterium]
MTPHVVLDFWFREIPESAWWEKNPDFDADLARRFGDWHVAAAAGELWSWRDTAVGRLAEILLLDQIPRNIFRDTPRAFATDSLALVLAQEAVRAGADRELPVAQRAFFYLPYMHSESLAVHAEALRLYAAPGLESNLDFERRHLAIIERFGRYPHRNAILGRASTADEMRFLTEPGSSF